ncbi:AAA family ATPase [Acinetobacter lwoffii]|uniref:AAA family ATPase n=1 Tax=Acinetobacter lwoffii TaxID=28090 RepID=A0AAW8AUY4_ACILW|nr:AAA family ATPase [Acinetobacter lwoffii]MDP1370408.1 AAA family ATPase [Acinetobacter lwoffii]MDP1389772.1 AAA family ATPase [Acinetobacter lwoffii]MDP1447446.1 AAA family ATPase [Acinetobacter lwoffii]
MHIQALQLKHTLHFFDIQLQFNYPQCPVTLILGNQGTGKTTLLRFSYQALTWFAARYRDSRAAGLVMQDQDIMQTRLQSKIDIQIGFPEEMGSLPESSQSEPANLQSCSWQIYKTLNSQGLGFSKAETSQLESVLSLYQKARLHDPLLGLPLIAYYPAERFTNEVNLLNKNNPAILQSAHAYEITAIPFTTFARFFEWFHEISDIENAQSAKVMNQILARALQQPENIRGNELARQIEKAQAHLHAPNLSALKQALSLILPEVSQIYLKYQPKLQLMVTYQQQTFSFQQLPNSIRNWIALVGDIVRRLCLLNPNSLFPCQEGTGVLLIDAIDHQLDQEMAAVILSRLHQAFPNLQIIATGNRPELLEQAQGFQCLKLENKQLHPIHLESMKTQFDQIYAELELQRNKDLSSEDTLLETVTEPVTLLAVLQMIREQLNPEQQQELLALLAQEHHPTLPQSL